MLEPLFPLGTVTIKEEAAYALEVSGQDADFFLQMHVTGVWDDADVEINKQALREGAMIYSNYHTLWGHTIIVVTFLKEGTTCLFCPPNSVINHIPLYDCAHWYTTTEEAMTEQPNDKSGTYDIGIHDMSGWVRIVSAGDSLPDNLPEVLGCHLAEWLRQRPQLRVVSVVPINRDGRTAELHAWYEPRSVPA